MLRIVTLLLLLPSLSFASPFSEKLAAAALLRTSAQVTYDGSYHRLAYPNGDVPSNIGVCTDVIIRSYRQLGIDLQVLVHEDMRDNFDLYPSKRIWGLAKTDHNIDHRRVPNLQVFFKRHGESLSLSQRSEDYRAGDIITWNLPGNLPHIGILVENELTPNTHPMVVHNIGSGPVIDDALFQFPITGHYRFEPRL